MREEDKDTNLSNIAARLADFGQELNACHPFFGAQARLSCEIVEMCD